MFKLFFFQNFTNKKIFYSLKCKLVIFFLLLAFVDKNDLLQPYIYTDNMTWSYAFHFPPCEPQCDWLIFTHQFNSTRSQPCILT